MVSFSSLRGTVSELQRHFLCQQNRRPHRSIFDPVVSLSYASDTGFVWGTLARGEQLRASAGRCLATSGSRATYARDNGIGTGFV